MNEESLTAAKLKAKELMKSLNLDEIYSSTHITRWESGTRPGWRVTVTDLRDGTHEVCFVDDASAISERGSR